MDSRGQLSPSLILGAVLLIVALLSLAFFSGFQLPSFEALSLRNVLCASVSTPSTCDPLNPFTFFDCFLFGFLQWLCFVALPVVAGVALAIIVLAWLISTFPPAAAVPIVLIVVAIFSFVIGFAISSTVLDFWWVFVILALVGFVIKTRFMGE